jgi:hypothetical protein
VRGKSIKRISDYGVGSRYAKEWRDYVRDKLSEFRRRCIRHIDQVLVLHHE